MGTEVSRRRFLGAMSVGAATVAAASPLAAAGSPEGLSWKIIGVVCSARQGKTTAQVS